MTTEERETEEAIDALTNPVETETIVQIPVQFWAHYEDGEITKWVVSPLESYAGYFGHGSFVFDGPEIDLASWNDETGQQGEFWNAVSNSLNPPGSDQTRSVIQVHWEE